MSYKLKKQYRLPSHDYSSNGYYFVTICTRNHRHFLGEIVDARRSASVPQMNLSRIGKIAKQFWLEIPNRFSYAKLDEFVIMPNHVQGIIIIDNQENDDRRRAPWRARTFGPLAKDSLSSIINHYKGNVKRWCNKNGFEDFVWQPKFHDSIIRDDRSLYYIQRYIKNNPSKWALDRNNLESNKNFMNKINLAVFASTKGTDFQAIIDALKSGELTGVDLKFVLSNKKDCYALERARLAGFKTVFIDTKGKSREEFDQECLKVCQEHQIDLIILIGYMRIITPALINAYKNKMMNIHPSLLPKYPGMDLDVHQEVLSNNEKETGCTLHFVTEELDGGPIIIQEKVSIEEGETVESLRDKIQALEQTVILKGIKQFRDMELK